MKNAIIYSLLFIAHCSIAQNWSFPDSNAIWSVYEEKFFIEGDSTAGNFDYKKIMRLEDSLATNPEFFALFRYDSITKKAYSIKSNSLEEKLLYDFDVSVNDTITVFPIGFVDSDSIRIRIVNIDLVQIDGALRKRIHLSGVDQNTGGGEFWIEGIGSSFGIFNPGLVGVTIFDLYYPVLLCFEVDGNLIYDNPDFTDCYEAITTGILEGETENRIAVFPNPVKSELHIKSESEIKEISILDYSGKTIFFIKVNSTEYQMDFDNFSDGIMILKIKSEKGIVIKRIIKKGL